MTRFYSVVFLLYLAAAPFCYGVDGNPSQELIQAPSPVDLRTDWRDYFGHKASVLRASFDAFKNQVNASVSKIEDEDTRKHAEQLIAEISARFESLQNLRNKTFEEPVYVWIPKESYSIEEYLDKAQQVRTFQHEETFIEAERQRLAFFIRDLRQEVSNALVEYSALTEPSLKKFMRGLELIAKHLRIRILSQEHRLVGQANEANESRQAHNLDELAFMEEHLTPDTDSNLDAEEGQTRREHAVVHSELLHTEAQTAKAYVVGAGDGATLQLRIQELTKLLLKESIFRTKLAVIKARKVLQQSFREPDSVDLTSALEDELRFLESMSSQSERWERVIVQTLDQLAHTVTTLPAEADDGEVPDVIRQNIILALESKVLLNKLSNELVHLELVVDLIEQQTVKGKSMGAKLMYAVSEFFSSLGETFEAWFYFGLFELGGVPITLAALLKAILIVIISLLFSRFVRSAIRQIARRRGKFDEATIFTFGTVVHYCILTLGFLIALTSMGLSLNNLAIVLGALGIGIGFGLQNIVNNFLSGLAILFDRNVKVGDYVEIETGHIGKITEINVLKTTVHTFDGVDVLVPNSEIMGQRLINWTKKDSYHRLHVPFSVAYGTDQHDVHRVVNEAARCVPSTVLEIKGIPEPQVWLVSFGDSSLDFELIVWVNLRRSSGRSSLRAAYLGAIESALKRNDISIPFPQRDLHIRTVPPGWAGQHQPPSPRHEEPVSADKS